MQGEKIFTSHFKSKIGFMKQNRIIIISAMLLVGFILGCSYKKDVIPQDDCTTINARFSAEVRPIIQGSCATNASCHGTGSLNGPGELVTFDQIQRASGSIKTAVESRRMPLGSSLSVAEISRISCWVNSGSLNN